MVKTNRLCLVVFYGWMEIVSFSFCVGFYGTMFLVYEEILVKKSKAASHFRLKGDQTLLK